MLSGNWQSFCFGLNMLIACLSLCRVWRTMASDKGTTFCTAICWEHQSYMKIVLWRFSGCYMYFIPISLPYGQSYDKRALAKVMDFEYQGRLFDTHTNYAIFWPSSPTHGCVIKLKLSRECMRPSLTELLLTCWEWCNIKGQTWKDYLCNPSGSMGVYRRYLM